MIFQPRLLFSLKGKSRNLKSQKCNLRAERSILSFNISNLRVVDFKNFRYHELGLKDPLQHKKSSPNTSKYSHQIIPHVSCSPGSFMHTIRLTV